MAKAKSKPAKAASECFACNGTGKTCNICGEAPSACECDEVEIEEYIENDNPEQFGDCETCKGTGK